MTLTDLRMQLRDNDWHAIPTRGKIPAVAKWERYCRSAPTDEEIVLWERRYPTATNTGIALGRQVCIDIDVASDPGLAQQLRSEAVTIFGPTPFVRVGKAPKVALIYRAWEPITTRRFKAASGNGDGIDVLSDGTQFIAFGIHPDTGQLYRWVGERSPLDAPPDDETPAITNAQVEAFLDRVHSWLPLGTGSSKAGSRPRGDQSAREIIRDASGLVIDGREEFLRACVWRAAGSLIDAHQPLVAEAVATLAWVYFTDLLTGADLRDGRWTVKHAIQKARGTVRRIREGKVELRPARQSIDPTYADQSKPLNEVRSVLDDAMRQHFEKEDEFWNRPKEAAVDLNESDTPDPDEAGDDVEVPASAIRVTTGAGKSSAVIEIIAERVKERDEEIAAAGGRKRSTPRPRRYVLLAPTLRLAEELAEKCRARGLTAWVFRGREADDPEQPGRKMCLDLEAVRMAIAQGEPVETSCCSNKGAGRFCEFHSVCSYQKQKQHSPQVWVGAHSLMFHEQTGLGTFDGLIVDESFWACGLWEEARELTVEQIEKDIPFGVARFMTLNDLDITRKRMGRAIRRHCEPGGLRQEHLVAERLSADECAQAIRIEWSFKEDNPFWPGMSKSRREAAADQAGTAGSVRAVSRMWEAAKDLLNQDSPDAVSGRVVLKRHESGELVLVTLGVQPIPKQWQIPTLILDATLPDVEILRAFFPQVEVLASLEAEMPHVTVRQVIGAPVSAKKLRTGGDEPSRNMLAICRSILWRYLEVGRQPTLVIAQKEFALWLRGRLPKGISVEWFNNIAGVDRYRDVRLVIAVGRTLPDVFTVEALAGTLKGLEPVKAVPQKNGTRWYDRVALGARLRDGSGVKIDCDRHPDVTAEAVRWQICEKEILQAFGRGRPTNRTPETPLDIDVMADVVLPITVDRVLTWDEVRNDYGVEMIAAGIWLDSPTDMAICWPEVWGTAEAARRWRSRATGQSPIERLLYRTLPGCCRYKLSGAGRQWHFARFDPTIIPDPQAWLEEKLGPLAVFEITPPSEEPDQQEAA
jgi:hypothetical protein